MKLTALACFYDKPKEVMDKVWDGLMHESWDQLVAVLDRPAADLTEWMAVRHYVHESVKFITIPGKPGWRSPCVPWNAGLKHVTGDHLLVIQGDVILQPGSLDFIHQALTERPAAYFGQVLESDPSICTGPGHAGPILCSSQRPRALTYLLALPTQAVKDIGGWDEAFQDGVWYEDDDFTARLWKHGLDFIFDDRLHGIHQSHKRTYYQPIRTAPNIAHMLRKHGTLRVYDRERSAGRLTITQQPGRTEWIHQGSL